MILNITSFWNFPQKQGTLNPATRPSSSHKVCINPFSVSDILILFTIRVGMCCFYYFHLKTFNKKRIISIQGARSLDVLINHLPQETGPLTKFSQDQLKQCPRCNKRLRHICRLLQERRQIRGFAEAFTIIPQYHLPEMPRFLIKNNYNSTDISLLHWIYCFFEALYPNKKCQQNFIKSLRRIGFIILFVRRWLYWILHISSKIYIDAYE